MFNILKYLMEYFIGDCGTCKHENNCPYIESGNGSCFEIAGFLPKYERRKIK